MKSPCINVCTLDRGEVCVGCGRHIDEIAAWGSASDALKQRIVEAARRRLAARQVPDTRQARQP